METMYSDYSPFRNSAEFGKAIHCILELTQVKTDPSGNSFTVNLPPTVNLPNTHEYKYFHSTYLEIMFHWHSCHYFKFPKTCQYNKVIMENVVCFLL